jgi:hypothetical protein
MIMTEAARKIEEPYVRVRRVTRPDLMDKAPFLCKRLREKYPHMQERQLYGWLTTCCDTNEYFFNRSDRAYILAHMSRDFLDLRPTVREIFVLGETDDAKHPAGSDAQKYQAQQNAIALHEAASLYGDLIRWCQSIGADEMIVDKLSDVPLGEKGTNDPGTLRWIFSRHNLKIFKGEEIFVSLDPEAKIRKLGA